MQKLFLFCTCCITLAATAQTISPENMQRLQQAEDSMMPYARRMIFEQEPLLRFEADSAFIKNLVLALRIPYSFQYRFDSILTVSKIYAPDSSFRIFTWQLERDESYYRQQGAIQMNTKDGSLKLFPLLDESDYTAYPTDSVRGANNWIGAIYYGMVMKEFNGKKYYTLFGYDDNDFASTRKWLDVLTFTNGQPRFGGRFFEYENDTIKTPQPVYRFLLEYKKDAHARMIYDSSMDMIVFDHLISETNEPQKNLHSFPTAIMKALNGKTENGFT